MKKLINIVYLAHRRMEYSNLLFLNLSKCKFKDFHITICSMNCAKDRAEAVVKNAIETYNLDASLFITYETLNNYLDKINYCINQDYEYSIKLDEDIFMGPHAWDYLFNNMSLLNNEDNLIISPALSSGIPTIDLFIKYNLNEHQKNELHNEFSKAIISNAWGIDYSFLNEALRPKYNEELFYNLVKNFNHYYKGIHPVRVNLNIQNKLNELIKNNINMFFQDRNFIIEELNRPYICNSIFAIKTNIWKNIINNKSLFVDNFDEVALNKYKEINNKKILFIANTFAIHTMYNTLWEYSDIDYINNIEECFYNFIYNYCKENIK